MNPILPIFLILPALFKKGSRDVKAQSDVERFIGKAKVFDSKVGKVDPLLKELIQRKQVDRGRFIVFAKNLEEDVQVLDESGYKVVENLPFIDAYIIEGSAKNVDSLANIDDIHYIMCDTMVTSHMNVVGKSLEVNRFHNSNVKGKGVTIAVLDTGVFPHVDLTVPKSRIIAFKDFINKKRNPYDDNGHGTFVAGVAAGNGFASNGKYKGVATDANIVGVKVMNKNGSGNVSDILAGMQWVVNQKEKYDIKVMSLSFGVNAKNIKGIDALTIAVEEVWRRGITVVASAGNEGPEQRTITSPGGSPSIITVGALDDKRTVDIGDDVVADISSRGPSYVGGIKPDLVAPGINITSLNAVANANSNDYVLDADEAYRTMSGTSVSAPIVSGVVALMLEQDKELSPDRIKKVLLDCAKNMKEGRNVSGYGRVWLEKLMELDKVG